MWFFFVSVQARKILPSLKRGFLVTILVLRGGGAGHTSFSSKEGRRSQEKFDWGQLAFLQRTLQSGLEEPSFVASIAAFKKLFSTSSRGTLTHGAVLFIRGC